MIKGSLPFFHGSNLLNQYGIIKLIARVTRNAHDAFCESRMKRPANYVRNHQRRTMKPA